VKVYLVGPISNTNAAYAFAWRDYATSVLESFGIRTIDPLRNLDELRNESRIQSAYPEWLWTTERAVVHRSLYDVRRSDVVLANFLGATERSVGSIVEIAVAYDRNIPVVVVLEPGNPNDHMFIREMAAVRTETLDDGIEAVWRLFAERR
jgi:nucleoside 2-deoxyribosyltransferase